MLQVWWYRMLQDAEWSVAIGPGERSARLVGEFDHSNAGAVLAVLSTICHPQPEVRVDVAQVTFCSSALITALIDARTRFADRGASMTLDPVSAVVQRVLTITDTSSLFQVVQ